MSKALVRFAGEITTPPLSAKARQEAGFLLRALQEGERLKMPFSRPMSSMGRRVHELRIDDGDVTWRIVYRIDEDAIVVLDVFAKKTQATSKAAIDRVKARIKRYDEVVSG